MPDRREDDAIEPQDPPSKSARKRQMLGLQAVGESLLSLNDNQLSKIPIDDERLLSAIRECRQIRSNSARKRHLQLIGKIMRNIDPAPIEQALAALHNTKQESTTAFHQLEQLREDILADGQLQGSESWPAQPPQPPQQVYLHVIAPVDGTL